jgi:hypothetical protein
MTDYEETVIVTNATAIRMRVSELCGQGVEMEAAKKQALDRYCFYAIPEYLRPAVRALVQAMTFADLDPEDRRKVDLQLFQAAVKYGFAKDTRWGWIRFKYLWWL